MGFGGLGMWEIILIFLVVLLLFGAKRLPEIGASLGKGIREFKGSLSEIEKEIKTPKEQTDSISSGSSPRTAQAEPVEKPEKEKEPVEAGGSSNEESESRGEPRSLRTEG